MPERGWVVAMMRANLDADLPSGAYRRMSDLLESKTNVAEFTVSEISNALKRTVEDAFGHVRVRGEISGYRGPHASGHAYFCLKDDRARMDAVIWKTTFQRLRFRPEEGMEIIATGRLTTYPGKSTYQIVIDSLEPAGAGALMALLEERKRRLAAEGLFEQARKRPLPFMPGRVGVITAPGGAVIRDIIHRIDDRFPLHILVWPVRVQGETCGAEVAAAIRGFNALPADARAPVRPDLLIVARGGGSLEDLWGFNDEEVVRAVAASTIPVISAVGHETDWTLIDLAADLRAPTPTGAAELAVPVKAELEAQLARLSARLSGAVSRSGDRKRQALRAASRALPSADQLLALPRRRFDEASARLERCLAVSTQRKRARLDAARLVPSVLARRLAEHRREAGQLHDRAGRAFVVLGRARRRHLAQVAARLRIQPVEARAASQRERLDRLALRHDRAFAALIEARQTRAAQAERLINSLSHRNVLKRGYAIVHDAEGSPLVQASDVRPGAALALEFADGQVNAVAAGTPAEVRGRTKRAEAPKAEQGSLF